MSGEDGLSPPLAEMDAPHESGTGAQVIKQTVDVTSQNHGITYSVFWMHFVFEES